MVFVLGEVSLFMNNDAPVRCLFFLYVNYCIKLPAPRVYKNDFPYSCDVFLLIYIVNIREYDGWKGISNQTKG